MTPSPLIRLQPFDKGALLEPFRPAVRAGRILDRRKSRAAPFGIPDQPLSGVHRRCSGLPGQDHVLVFLLGDDRLECLFAVHDQQVRIRPEHPVVIRQMPFDRYELGPSRMATRVQPFAIDKTIVAVTPPIGLLIRSANCAVVGDLLGEQRDDGNLH